MLVLTRRVGDKLVLTHAGVKIEIKVNAIQGQKVRVGITAPASVEVLREELLDGKRKEAGRG